MPAGIRSPERPDQRLAISLFREAGALNKVAYQFLAYFKIINIRHKDGREQVAWINNRCSMIEDLEAVARVGVIQHVREDVGEYLYGSGRCAVAHAFSEPTVDPDEVEETNRLRRDLPVIRAPAIDLMVNELEL